MEFSLAQCANILDTLPIGLYAHSRIECTLSDKEPTSFFNPVTCSITISYPIIAEALKKVTDESLVETAVRTMLYHEVSHAILTPSRLSINDIINIAEDERIETLLQDYYLDTNFKWLAYQLGDDGKEPTTYMELFWKVVRLRQGTPHQLQLVADFCKAWAHLTRNHNDYFDRIHYADAVERLFTEITGVSPERAGHKMPPQPKDGEGKDKGDGEAKDEGEGESCGEEGESKEQKIARACAEQAKGRPVHGKDTARSMVQEAISSVIGHNYDAELHTSLQQIFMNFNKKNNSGNAMASHSGIFNPRLCARDDYRFFDRMTSARGANTFGSLHLNLFIDRSGSFHSEQEKVNTLLHSLLLLERSLSNFTFDVVTIGTNEKLLTKNDLRLECGGGNNITPYCFDLVRELQKPNTYNYNLVLFDGDAFSDDYHNNKKTVNFKPFNLNNCTIISDRDNERYISKSVYKAKVIYTHDYVRELYDNVLTTLQNAFR